MVTFVVLLGCVLRAHSISGCKSKRNPHVQMQPLYVGPAVWAHLWSTAALQLLSHGFFKKQKKKFRFFSRQWEAAERFPTQAEFYIPLHQTKSGNDRWPIIRALFCRNTSFWFDLLLHSSPPTSPLANTSIFSNQSFGLYCTCSHIPAVTRWWINW